jgi:hypothetical protein
VGQGGAAVNVFEFLAVIFAALFLSWWLITRDYEDGGR